LETKFLLSEPTFRDAEVSEHHIYEVGVFTFGVIGFTSHGGEVWD
jgi:hypothetical protein